MHRAAINNSLGHVALLISIYFPPEPGGGSSAAWNRALILHKIGYTVFVICGFPSYPKGKVMDQAYKGKLFCVEKIENCTLIRLRLLPLESKGYLRRFILFMNFIFLALFWSPRILRIAMRVELVYAIAPILFSSFIGFWYSKVTSSFFVYEVSALWPEELVAFKTNLSFIVAALGKILAKISYTLPDILIAISELAAEYVVNNYRPGVITYALPIGVEPTKYKTQSMKSSRKELIENEIFAVDLEHKFIILYSGIITKVTRVENLVYAAKKLKNHNDIAFVIVGEGEEKERLEEIKLSEHIDNVFFLPFQKSAFVPHIITAADICVVSLSSEAIYEATVPSKFFDYLACHKAQIGICTGELANMINSGMIGITVKHGETDKLVDAILSLKKSPALVRTMEHNSVTVLKDFSLDTLAQKFGNVLKKEIIKKTQMKGKY